MQSPDSPRSSPSSRYFAFLRTPSTQLSPIPFLTQRVHGRSAISDAPNIRARLVLHEALIFT